MKKLKFSELKIRELTRKEMQELSGADIDSSGASGTISEGIETSNGQCYALRVCRDGLNTATVSCSGPEGSCHLTSIDADGVYIPFGVRCGDTEAFCDRVALPSGFDPSRLPTSTEQACRGKQSGQICQYIWNGGVMNGRCVGHIGVTDVGTLYCSDRER